MKMSDAQLRSYNFIGSQIVTDLETCKIKSMKFARTFNEGNDRIFFIDMSICFLYKLLRLIKNIIYYEEYTYSSKKII